MVDYSISAKNRIYTEIRDSHLQQGIEVNHIDLDRPFIDDAYSRNTRLLFNVHINTGDHSLINCVAMYYTRPPVAQVFSTNPVLDKGTALTTHDLLPLILDQHGINLDPEDILDEPLTGDVITINAAPDSYGFTGSLTFVDLSTGGPFIEVNGALLLVNNAFVPVNTSIFIPQ